MTFVLTKLLSEVQRTEIQQKGYKVPELAENLIHLPDLLLVFQVNWSVEVRNFVFFCCTLAHDVIFTWMDELSQCCTVETQETTVRCVKAVLTDFAHNSCCSDIKNSKTKRLLNLKNPQQAMKEILRQILKP